MAAVPRLTYRAGMWQTGSRFAWLVDEGLKIAHMDGQGGTRSYGGRRARRLQQKGNLRQLEREAGTMLEVET